MAGWQDAPEVEDWRKAPEIGAAPSQAKPRKPAPAGGVPGIGGWGAAGLHYLGGALANAPADAANVAASLWHMVRHLPDTIQGVRQVGGGIIKKGYDAAQAADTALAAHVPGVARINRALAPVNAGLEKVLVGSDPAAAEQSANAAGRYVADSYGSPQKALETFRTHPVQTAMDVSSLLSGGEMALARAAPRTAAAMGETARVTNPLNLATGIMGKALPAKKVGPTLEQVEAQKNAAYQAVESAGVKVTTGTMRDLNNEVKAAMRSKYYDPRANVPVKQALALVRSKINRRMSLPELDALRQNVRDKGYTLAGRDAASPREQAMVGQMVRTIDDHLKNLTPGDVVAGDATTGLAMQNQARALAQKVFKTKAIDEATQNARDLSQQQPALSYGDALRKQFSKIVNDDTQMRQFSPEEQSAVRDVANGTKTRRALDFLTRWAPKSLNWLGLEGLGAYAAATHGETAGATILSALAAGTAARKGAEMMNVAAANRARNLVLGVHSVPRQLPPVVPKINKALVPLLRLQEAQQYP